MSKKPLIEQDLSPVAQHVNDWYGGNVNAVCSRLDGILFMLLFLEEEAFSRKEIQQAGYAIKQLRDSFGEILALKAPS
jgi:hypothetical protein